MIFHSPILFADDEDISGFKKDSFNGYVKYTKCSKIFSLGNSDDGEAIKSGWLDIVTKTNDFTDGSLWNKRSIWENNLKEVKEKYYDEHCDVESPPTEKNQQMCKKFAKIVHTFHQYIQTCHGLARIETLLDIEEQEEMRQKRINENRYKVSVDGKLKCFYGEETTQDASACLTALNTYNGFFTGKKFTNVAQGYQFQKSSLDAQTEYQKNPTDPNAALQAQKTTIDSQKRIANQNLTLDSAQAITLKTMAAAMPDITKLEKEICKKDSNKMAKGFYSNILEGKSEYIKELSRSFKDELSIYEKNKSKIKANLNACQIVINNNDNYRLIINQGAVESLNQLAANAAASAMANLGKSMLLNDQSQKISGIMKEVDEFKPDFPTAEFEDIQVDECQMNPTAEGCQVDLGTTEAPINGNIITFGGGNGGISYGEEVENDDAPGPEISGLDKKNEYSGKGLTAPSAISGDPKGGGGLNPADAPAQASMKKVSGGAGGGGGGGGAGGGGTGPAEGAPQNTNGQGSVAAKNPHGIKARKRSGLSAWRGGSRSKRGSKGDNNPLAGLFKKKRKRGGKIENLRGPASLSSKSSDLFGIISGRYAKVKAKGRLLKYDYKP